MHKAEKRLQAILQKYSTSGFTKHHFKSLDVARKYNYSRKKIVWTVIASLFILLGTQLNLFDDSQCLIEIPSEASKIFREPENCDMCTEITQIKKVANISSSEFYANFVSLTKPIVISDGAKNWPALEHFSFEFFKKLYESTKFNSDIRLNCQFFPYKTEFKSLEEVLNMNIERASLQPGEKPWYIGWSNCNDATGKILRKYYNTPYFIPNTSENIALNWIFMGGPGFGAHMHVDNVQYPSWQAQLKGRKLWLLAPPPECIYKCQEIQIIVEPGEIIVIDTNRWYHQTFILPGEISITIGSEFD